MAICPYKQRMYIVYTNFWCSFDRIINIIRLHLFVIVFMVLLSFVSRGQRITVVRHFLFLTRHQPASEPTCLFWVKSRESGCSVYHTSNTQTSLNMQGMWCSHFDGKSSRVYSTWWTFPICLWALWCIGLSVIIHHYMKDLDPYNV